MTQIVWVIDLIENICSNDHGPLSPRFEWLCKMKHCIQIILPQLEIHSNIKKLFVRTMQKKLILFLCDRGIDVVNTHFMEFNLYQFLTFILFYWYEATHISLRLLSFKIQIKMLVSNAQQFMLTFIFTLQSRTVVLLE